MRSFSIGVLLIFFSVFFQARAEAILTFDAGFFVTETYTDNLFFSENQKEDDFGTYLGPILNIKFENPDVVLGVEYRGTVQLWVNNTQANTYTQNSNITLDLPFLEKRYRGLSVQITENFNFTPQLDAFSLSLADQNNTAGISNQGNQDNEATQGAFTSRANVFQNNAGLRIGYEWTARLNTNISYQNRYTHFFSGGLQDSISHTGSGGGNYRVNNETTVGLTYSFTQTDYTNNPNQTGGQLDRTRTHRIIGSLSYQFTPSLTGDISGGPGVTRSRGSAVSLLDPPPGVQPEIVQVSNEKQVTTIISANLVKTYQQGQMGISYNQNIGDGGGLLNQPVESKTVTGRIFHEISRKLGGFISFGWAKNKSVSGNSFRSTSYRIQTGLDYVLASWLTGNFSYSYLNQDSKGASARSATVNQFFLGLTAYAPPWRIFN